MHLYICFATLYEMAILFNLWASKHIITEATINKHPISIPNMRNVVQSDFSDFDSSSTV